MPAGFLQIFSNIGGGIPKHFLADSLKSYVNQKFPPSSLDHQFRGLKWLLKILDLFVFILCVWVFFLRTCMCMNHMCSWYPQRKMELQRVVSHHIGALKTVWHPMAFLWELKTQSLFLEIETGVDVVRLSSDSVWTLCCLALSSRPWHLQATRTNSAPQFSWGMILFPGHFMQSQIRWHIESAWCTGKTENYVFSLCG